MELIDEQTQKEITRMLDTPADDWRTLAVVAKVAPTYLQEMLNQDLFEKDEKEQFGRELESYRKEIDAGLTEALAPLLRYAEYETDRKTGRDLHRKLTKHFWEWPVQSEPDLRAAIEKAAEEEMRKVPTIA